MILTRKSARHAPAPVATPPRGSLPARDLPPARVRQRHVRDAQRLGVLSAAEARHMRDCIGCGIDEFDIYPHPYRAAEWEVWTHDGPRTVRWWQALYAQYADCQTSARAVGQR